MLPKDLNPVKIASDSRCSTLYGPKTLHSHSQFSSPRKKLDSPGVQSPSKVVVQKRLVVPVMPKQFQMSNYFSMQKGMKGGVAKKSTNKKQENFSHLKTEIDQATDNDSSSLIAENITKSSAEDAFK